MRSLILISLISFSAAQAHKVANCTIDEMIPVLRTYIENLVDKEMKAKGIDYLPQSLSIKNHGKETWTDFYKSVTENSFRVTFETRKGNTLSLVTPTSEVSNRTFRSNLTFLIPEPTVKEERDAEGNILSRKCVLWGGNAHSYERYYWIVNLTQGNFLVKENKIFQTDLWLDSADLP